MASNAQRIFSTRGSEMLTQALTPYVGGPGDVISSANFATMCERLWEALPAPVRLLGKDRLRWDELMHTIRKHVVASRAGVLCFRPEPKARIEAVFRELYGQTESEALETEDSPVPAAAPAAATSQEIVIGIDLGTTYSAAAYVDATGRPQTLLSPTGERTVPSVVFFDSGRVLVGRDAVKAAMVDPQLAADCVKRDMGRKHYRRKVAGEWMPPEAIASMILRSIKNDAERKLGPIKRAVITVPAYFDEPKRRATMDAGRLAGLEVLDIVNEPTAAAIAYGLQSGFLNPDGSAASKAPVRVLVYDLGGGTFDVSIVEIQDRQFKTLATDGDFGLGGRDWDEQLAQLAAKAFETKFGLDPLVHRQSSYELLREAEEAKCVLSDRTETVMLVGLGDHRLRLQVDREQFEEATAGLLRRTRTTTELALRNANLDWNDIDRILLVGGSTRMPMVSRMLEQISGRPADRSLSPDEAVAHGAALYARLIADKHGSKEAAFAVTNVNSHSLGIAGINPRTKKKRNRILIPKNTPLPASVTRRFRTFKDGQRNVSIEILEGESKDPTACTRVGKCRIVNLPPGLPAGWPVHITYRYAENGRLDVSAKLQGRLAEVSAVFVRDDSLPEGDLLLWAEYVEESVGYLKV